MKFKDVKQGDKLLVERSHYNDRGFYVGHVSKVTSTRFSVASAAFGEIDKTFTKDGNQYPRETGYGRSYIQLSEMTPEAELKIKKHRMSNKARHLALQLNEIFENANFREQIASQDLDHNELDESIKMLEATYERFKKYGPKK